LATKFLAANCASLAERFFYCIGISYATKKQAYLSIKEKYA